MRLEGMAAGSLGKGHAVLVVDDDADVREALAELVATSGRPVFTAADGGEALELLDADAVPRPCLVLLDLMMAPMDGRAFHTLPRELPLPGAPALAPAALSERLELSL
jgi:CheY-like chemotaxis protein